MLNSRLLRCVNTPSSQAPYPTRLHFLLAHPVARCLQRTLSPRRRDKPLLGRQVTVPRRGVLELCPDGALSSAHDRELEHPQRWDSSADVPAAGRGSRWAPWACSPWKLPAVPFLQSM